MVFCPELMFVVCSLHLYFYKVYGKQSDELIKSWSLLADNKVYLPEVFNLVS